MEFFHEIYSAYFQVVRKILLESAKSPLTTGEMKQISQSYAFEESFLSIIPKLTEGSWSSLLTPSKEKYWSCALSSVSSRPQELLKAPLTRLQKSWIKALLSDPRFRLFFSEEELTSLARELSQEEPLYLPEDFHYYDRFSDQDPYEDPYGYPQGRALHDTRPSDLALLHPHRLAFSPKARLLCRAILSFNLFWGGGRYEWYFR